MLVQEDSRGVPNRPPVGNGAFVNERAEEIGGALEAFRNDLRMVARRGLAHDLAAKVDASDLVQETFLAAGRDIAQFEGNSPAELRCWLRGILQHLLANARRRYRGTRKRRVEREVPLVCREAGADRDRGVTISASATSPSGRAMRQEREAALCEALAALPEHYRRVIQWHHQERLPFEAVADRLGISPDAARKLWGRALIRLRDALGPDHDPR